MADYGIMRSGDLRRVAAATRRVEGMPRTFLEVPQQIANRGSNSIPQSILQGLTNVWTIAEYNATTGEIVKKLDRGRRRQTNKESIDIALLLSSDGFLYAAGARDIDRSDGNIVKWDIDATVDASRVWDSTHGGLNPTVFHDLGGSGHAAVTLYAPIFEASDGFIWGVVGRGTDDYVSRTNPTTGAQTHSYTLTVGVQAIYQADNSGGVVIAGITDQGGGVYARVLDATATSTATFTSQYNDMYEDAGVLSACSTSQLYLRNADDLTSIDSRAPVADTYFTCCHDGTLVYVTGSSTYYAYDQTNLATLSWSAATRPNNRSHHLTLNGGSLWDCFYQSGSNSVGGLAKVDPTDGSVDWSYTAAGSVYIKTSVAFGTDFVVIVTFSTGGYDIVCLEKSSGSVRWRDFWTRPMSVVITADDRVFICGERYGP